MDGAGTWRRWFVRVTAAEVCGFAVPAVVGTRLADAPAGVQLVALAAAGLVEGGVLGLAQAGVLHRRLPDLDRLRWTVATSLAAALAWAIGMTPSATHSTWSHWPTAVSVVVGLALGGVLLSSIGVAQALVLPPTVRRRWTWILWTALGWCVGLGAFAAVAPPLWHAGQPTDEVAAIGVLGGAAMAAAMAATTGLAATRLVRLATHQGTSGADGADGAEQQALSAVIGGPAYDAQDRYVGTITDLVADLGTAMVTGVLVRTPGRDRARFAVGPLAPGVGRPGWRVGSACPPPDDELAPTEVLVRRDILDAPAITTAPHHRGRISDLLLRDDGAGPRIAGVDLTTRGVALRVLGRAPAERDHWVPLSAVHLASPRGHVAQLATPNALVHHLAPDALAEVLTRTPLAHARDIVRATDTEVGHRALDLLHPSVRDRVTGQAGPPRPMLRHRGWRLHGPHRPDHRDGRA